VPGTTTWQVIDAGSAGAQARLVGPPGAGTREEPSVTAFDDLAQRYIDTWNETNADARAAAVAALYAEEARYVDPLVDAAGHDAITATIGAVQQRFPGFRFRLAGPVDAHHDQFRFRWELGPTGAAEAPIAGSDVAVRAGDGRLAGVVGFLDRVPSA
jgi:SnoaL-like protein